VFSNFINVAKSGRGSPYFWAMNEKYLEELNQPQRDAVVNTDGPMMVIAGAGSGKTRVLTFRIAHLINKGVDPFHILALTFTNKAAREMKDRIGKIVGPSEAKNIWMGTFHSVFAKILRVEADRIGYPKDFTIYDTADAKNLVKDIIREMSLDDKIYKPGLVYNRISSAKNNLISAGAYATNTDLIADDRMSGKPLTAEIYQRYETRCFKAGAMDFDDLLFKTNVLLRDFPDILHRYQQKFRYILVDEYQDTNYAQYLIVKKLAAMYENLCVVGDDAQSIYAFRGANIQNILNFKKDYPDYKIYKLEQNYRSTKVIVHAANSVIQKNKEQIQKNVWTSNEEGNPIKVFRAVSDNEEGRIITEEIQNIQHQERALPKDFAILYRTNAQSRSFEESLRKMNIPYRIYGGLSFYQRKEIKDLLAYFRLTANHNDEEALKRVINYPKRGIGDTTVDALIVAASENQTGIWNVVELPEMYQVRANGGSLNKVKEFATMIKSFKAQMNTVPAYELASQIATSSGILKDLYDDKSPEGVSRYENIQELLNGIKEFSENATEEEPRTLTDFLIDVALLTDADQNDPEGDNKVTLMTIHAAKGLEFPFVFIVGMEENLFPSQLSLNSRTELEEERRLFYVALTRAEKRCHLSYAQSRYRWGSLTHCEPSRFIEEIDTKYLELPPAPKEKAFDFEDEWGTRDFKKSGGFNKPGGFKKDNLFGDDKEVRKKPAAPAPEPPPVKKNLVKIDERSSGSSSEGTSSADLQVGTNVRHEKFGKGKVLSIEGTEPNVKATVFFPEVGQKQLLLKFAKLDIID
jgi:DNA helicase-2/ATP-dependent DNA helicase PcrA